MTARCAVECCRAVARWNGGWERMSARVLGVGQVFGRRVKGGLGLLKAAGGSLGITLGFQSLGFQIG